MNTGLKFSFVDFARDRFCSLLIQKENANYEHLHGTLMLNCYMPSDANVSSLKITNASLVISYKDDQKKIPNINVNSENKRDCSSVDYTLETLTTNPYIDISDGTQVTLNDDESSGGISIGFDFPFYVKKKRFFLFFYFSLLHFLQYPHFSFK